jgi:hypothetical protein
MKCCCNEMEALAECNEGGKNKLLIPLPADLIDLIYGTE